MSYKGSLRPQPPTAQTGEDHALSRHADDAESWLKRAREAYYFSTTYLDENYRKEWEDSIRAFNNMHPSDSKYNQDAYSKRSRLFRPKIRTVIRKNEAAAAAAYFSNMEIADFKAVDESNPKEVASAELMKQLLQYRLTKSIPWFKLVMGAIQDAQVTAACAHVYWEYKKVEIEADEHMPVSNNGSNEGEDDDESGTGEEEYPKQNRVPDGAEAVEQEPEESSEAGEKSEDKMDVARERQSRKIEIDRPVVDLFPIENLRIDPSASWIDPVADSPYLIHMIPVYVMDLKDRIQSGEWMSVSLNQVRQAMGNFLDSTRVARNRGRSDPQSEDNRPDIRDYEIVWVQRHIHRRYEIDWEFYTLGDVCLLSTPKPLLMSVFHGKRPYVVGSAVIETHKILASSIPQLGKELQAETNEIVNQRIDNVKFVLNKKWFARRGAEVDLGGLVRNVPGGIVLTDDPEKDIKEVNWPDVTSSAYQETKGLDNDLNELLGNFSSASLLMDRNLNAPAHNMSILNNSTGTLTEYMLRTFNETWVQPVLRQVILLEQHYETDETILAIAGKKAKLWQKFGVDQITDDLLMKEITMSINVGMGATDPQLKLQKFLVAVNTYTQMLQRPIPGLNVQEIGKEVFGYLGYSDPTRFFTMDNPQVAVLMQKLQQAMQMINQLQAKVKEKNSGHMVNLEKTKVTAQSNIMREDMKQRHEDSRAVLTHVRALHEAGLNMRMGLKDHFKPVEPVKPAKAKKNG